MTQYTYDSTGRITKQWWYCNHCKVNFWRYMETCPVCEGEAEARGKDNDGERMLEGILQRIPGRDEWGRLRPSQQYQFGWEIEPI